MKPTSPSPIVAAAATLAAAFFAGTPAAPSIAATPPPTPPPITAPVSPAPAASDTAPSPAAAGSPLPIPTGFALPGVPASKTKPGATPTPPPSTRKGIEGVWEVAIQRGGNTEYTHFALTQQGNNLSGTYRDSGGKAFPINGSIDGQQVHLVVSLPDGTTTLIEGKLDGTSDMVGMLTTAKEQVYFSAEWRPKEKWIENVNTTPGGFGGASSGGGLPGVPP